MITLPAYANEPLFPGKETTSIEKSTRIPQLDRAYTAYGMLAYPGHTNYYHFYGKKGDVVTFEMAVPKLAGHEKFRPSFAIIGPGLPTVGFTITPLALPPGSGVYVVEPSGRDREAIDPMTGTAYWITQAFRLTIPVESDYYIVVYNAEGHKGKYALRLGNREEVSVVTALFRPVQFLQIRAWYNPTQLLAVMALLSMACVLFLLGWLGKKRRRHI